MKTSDLARMEAVISAAKIVSRELSKIHNMSRVDRIEAHMPSWNETPRSLHDAHHILGLALATLDPTP